MILSFSVVSCKNAVYYVCVCVCIYKNILPSDPIKSFYSQVQKQILILVKLKLNKVTTEKERSRCYCGDEYILWPASVYIDHTGTQSLRVLFLLSAGWESRRVHQPVRLHHWTGQTVQEETVRHVVFFCLHSSAVKTNKKKHWLTCLWSAVC